MAQRALWSYSADKKSKAAEVISSSVAFSVSAAMEEVSRLVNVNTADLQTLCTLPGIGKAKAEAIIAYRLNNGPFTSLEELTEVDGIGEKIFAQIRDSIVLE